MTKPDSESRLRAYYQLTKPGIIYGNLLTATAGYLFAGRWHIDWAVLAGLLAGTSLVIASACVFNNYLDRGLDVHMRRTSRRALVTGRISVRSALVYSAVLGGLGFLTLALWTNGLVVLIGAAAFIDYVVLYGLAKRRSVHGTLVGTIAGAAPVTAGYCAFTGHFDGSALLLFLIMAVWQMPHFYAIALYRLKDYRAAGLPVWPVRRGAASTKRQITGYILAFIVVNILLGIFGHATVGYVVIMTAIGGYWLWAAVGNSGRLDDRLWGRRLFLRSLVVMVGLSLMLSVGSIFA